MSSEYVKISPPEKHFGERSLLESQARVLQSLKYLESYKKLRNHEILLKINLKKQIEEAKTHLHTLKKTLPSIPKQGQENHNQEQKFSSIDSELENIKSKLQSLQGETSNIP